MVVELSDREVAILLGATLMHWGVPFRFSAKRPFTENQQATVDGASEKLIALNQELRSQASPAGADLEPQEISLLTTVVEDCLTECGVDAIELDLQLKTRDRQEVEYLLRRLRGLLHLPSSPPIKAV